MQVHEYGSIDENNRQWCNHCGALKHERILVTCIDRAIPGRELMPEPKRREYASESWDAIGVRLAELQRERNAATNAVSVVVATADEVDWMCG